MSNNNLVPGFNDEKDDSLKINLEKINDVDNGLVIYLNGYIDTYNSSFFQKRLSQRAVTSFFSKFSQKFTRYSSFWDSLSSSISKILCRTQSTSSNRALQFQKASSQKFSVARSAQRGSRPQELVVSAAQNANLSLPSTSTVRFSWARSKALLKATSKEVVFFIFS